MFRARALDMTAAKNTLRPPVKGSMHCLPMQIGLNASRGPRKYIVDDGATSRSSHNFQDVEKKAVQKETRLHRNSNLEKRQQRLENLSASDPDYSRKLDMKECMLEVQAALIRKLAAEENRIKGFMETFELSDMNFNERVRDVEEGIQALQY